MAEEVRQISRLCEGAGLFSRPSERQVDKKGLEPIEEKSREWGKENRMKEKEEDEGEEERNLLGACRGWKTSKKSQLWAWRTKTLTGSNSVQTLVIELRCATFYGIIFTAAA